MRSIMLNFLQFFPNCAYSRYAYKTKLVYTLNSFQQMGDEVKVMKEEREKMIRSQKTLKGKLEKAVNIEEVYFHVDNYVIQHSLLIRG